MGSDTFASARWVSATLALRPGVLEARATTSCRESVQRNDHGSASLPRAVKQAKPRPRGGPYRFAPIAVACAFIVGATAFTMGSGRGVRPLRAMLLPRPSTNSACPLGWLGGSRGALWRPPAARMLVRLMAPGVFDGLDNEPLWLSGSGGRPNHGPRLRCLLPADRNSRMSRATAIHFRVHSGSFHSATSTTTMGLALRRASSTERTPPRGLGWRRGAYSRC